MHSIRLSTLGTAAMVAALLAALPAGSFAASGDSGYWKAQEQRDVASLHRDATLQPRPPEEEITQQARQPDAMGQTSSAVDCADPANTAASVCNAPR